MRDPGEVDRPIREETDLSPDAVIARVSAVARELARRDGGLAPPHAVAEFRTAYQRLWDLYQETIEDDPSEIYWPADAS